MKTGIMSIMRAALPKAEHWSWIETFDEKSNTYTLRGISYGLPGILKDRGRVIFDDENEIVFRAGHWPQLNDGLALSVMPLHPHRRH